MKLTIKTLKGEIFNIEAEAAQTVHILSFRSKMSRIRSKKPKDSRSMPRN